MAKTRFERLRDGLCTKPGSLVFDASRPSVRGVLNYVGPALATVKIAPRTYRRVQVGNLRKIAGGPCARPVYGGGHRRKKPVRRPPQ